MKRLEELRKELKNAKNAEDKQALQEEIDRLEGIEDAEVIDEKVSTNSTGGTMEVNGIKYDIAARRNRPKTRTVYAKATLDLTSINDEKRGINYASCIVANIIGTDGQEKTVFFKYKDQLPEKLAHLEADLSEGSKEYNISFVEESHLAGRTTFEFKGEELTHNSTGVYAANIFNLVDKGMLEASANAGAARLKTARQNAQLLAVNNALKVIENMDSHTVEEVEKAMAMLG